MAPPLRRDVLRARGPGREGGDEGARPGIATETDTERGGGRRLICRSCGHLLSRTSARILVRGEHSHVCVNPSGIPFRIGCFSTAPGVAPFGRPESYWSWFAGYRWQIVLCVGCNTHVGWAFLGDEDHFFGLIEARIMESDEEQ